MPEDREWSWVGEDGVVHGLGEDELTFALSSEEIPAYALVSHKTWAEWLPAMQVAELLWALPSGHADAPRKAEVLGPDGVRRPPPISDLPEFKSRFEDIRSGRVDPKAESHSGQRAPLPTPHGDELDLSKVVDSEFDAVLENLEALGDDDDTEDQTGVLGFGQRSSLPGQAAASRTPRAAPAERPPRGKLPSFSEGLPRAPRRDMPSSSSLGSTPPSRPTFDSDAAPRPRSTPKPATPRPSTLGLSTPRPSTPRPSTPRPSTPRPSTPRPSTPRPSSQRANTSSPTRAAPVSSRPPAIKAGEPPPPPRPPSPSAPALASPVLPEPEASSPAPVVPARLPAPSAPDLSRLSRPSRPSLSQAPVQLNPSEVAGKFKSGPRLVHFLFVAAALAVIGAGVWVSLHAENDEPVAVVPSVTAAPEPPKPKKLVTGCQAPGQPTRVFEFAKPEVKPVWGDAVGSARVPLGFAQTSRLALGLMVSAANLSGTVLDRQDDPSPMLSVVPRTRGGESEFLVERAASRLQTARAVPAAEPFAIGLRGKTIGARVGKQDRDLWPSVWETLSVPEVARLDADSYVMALRGGGQRGAVVVGKVSEQGRAVGDLQTLEIPAARVGEPSLAVSEKHILVAADGGPDTDMGQLFVAVAERPALPQRATRVTSVDAPASVPSIVALPSGGFFLQWTDGPVGSQRIRGRVFDRNLDARGETFTLSEPGSDAHHGVSTWVGDRLLTVYFVRLPTNNHELWANALTCTTREE